MGPTFVAQRARSCTRKSACHFHDRGRKRPKEKAPHPARARGFCSLTKRG
ncbi:hypothetical protein AKJ09_02449 [Labilithrix luteola]|uniref:Uncharacterized protein n=1 Tax=Labilithrix luteola TaxID=1391654 RepID=A0A0K1PQG7_9BACT|nr:hypothetical protein AKJ09_02449 [Labilithrix luteola]